MAMLLHKLRLSSRQNEKSAKLYEFYRDNIHSDLICVANYLNKMSMQCNIFSYYSTSILVLSSIYASTAFFKHAKSLHTADRNHLVYWLRHTVFDIVNEENMILKNQIDGLSEVNKGTTGDVYYYQHNPKFIEQIAMD